MSGTHRARPRKRECPQQHANLDNACKVDLHSGYPFSKQTKSTPARGEVEGSGHPLLKTIALARDEAVDSEHPLFSKTNDLRVSGAKRMIAADTCSRTFAADARSFTATDVRSAYPLSLTADTRSCMFAADTRSLTAADFRSSARPLSLTAEPARVCSQRIPAHSLQPMIAANTRSHLHRITAFERRSGRPLSSTADNRFRMRSVRACVF